ncbi:MAG: hypothetical protein Q7J45_00670 [bacterium]|nr:hypothetical protein [bacterium]
MTRAIVYPSTLPGVSSFSKTRAARAQVSEDRGYARGRMRDRVYSADVVWEIPKELMSVWDQWYETDMLRGQRRCSIPLPCETGIVASLAKFTTEIKHEVIPGFGYRISGTLQVTGLTRP